MSLKSDSAVLSDKDYDFICGLVYERSRIDLGRDKQTLVSSRLNRRLRQLHLQDYSQYCQLLRSADGEEELPYLLDRISTNHTNFFREIKHFEFLRHSVLSRRAEKVFRVWSAACSSGEEPYSLAIWLAEHLAPAGSGRWQIEASDISTQVLELARQGIYEGGRLDSVSEEWLRRYFQRGLRDWEGRFRVKADLRARVRFHHLNLLQRDYPFAEPFQVIFCRNVMIYFDRPTQEELVARLAEMITPGGYLMVGHSESLSGVKHSLRLVQPAIYLKPPP